MYRQETKSLGLLPQECGVQLLAAQKSINRPSWWKARFPLFQMLATGCGEGGGHLSKGWLFLPYKQGVKAFIGRVYVCEEGGGAACRNSIVISTGHLQIGHQWSHQYHLGCFKFSSVHLLSCVQLFATPWTATCQASLSITNSESLLKLMSVKSVMPSNPLSSPSPPAFNISQHQGLFQWVSSLHQVAKVLEFQLQHQSFQWIFRVDFL